MGRRVEPDTILLHAMRAAIFDALREHGQLSLTTLAANCGCTTSTILWHAGKLQAAGLVESSLLPRSRVYRALTNSQADRSHAIRLLSDKAARSVMKKAVRDPGCLVADPGSDERVNQELAQRLQDGGLLDLKLWGNEECMFPTALGRQLVR